MKQPSVDIIILNWNGYNDTSQLIESLSKISYKNYNIIIIDNNSDNNEAKKIENTYGDQAYVIRNNENLGFTGGNNTGIKYSLDKKVDYILLLNNDTIVEPDFLDILVNKFETDSSIGIVAPRINYYDEPKKIWTEGGKISRLRGSGFAYSEKMETEVKIVDKQVTFVSGCCMLIKKDVFLKIGLFDENYFLYTEDTDLCLRTIQAGYKIYISPQSKIYHKVGGSTKENSGAIPLYYTTRNRLFFAKKHFGISYLFTVIYIFCTMSIKSIIWIIRGRVNYIKAIRLAFKDFFRNRMGRTEHTFQSKELLIRR